jgi:hypothetical protein
MARCPHNASVAGYGPAPGVLMRLLRSCLHLLLPAFAGIATLGCQEQEFHALRPEFHIAWPEEFGYVDGDLAASAMRFGTVTTGQVAQFEVRLDNPGTADLDMLRLEIAEVSFDENGDVGSEVRVDLDPELSTNAIVAVLPKRNSVAFTMRFTPLYGTPLREGLYFVVSHELNDDDPLYIPILGEGFGEPVPDIYGKPASVDFGTLQAGQTAPSVDVRVGNAGPGLLTVGSVTLDDTTNFSLEAASLANLPFAYGEWAERTVGFHPTSAGNFSATVTVNSDDPDEPQFTIPLFGVADAVPVGKAPIAVCGPTITSAPLQTESFDGSGSNDPGGYTPLTYAWSVITRPNGSSSTLSSGSTANPSLFLDLAGTYVGQLVVTNTQGTQSLPCTQTIEAIPNENFRIELFWQFSGDDQDLHLLEANNGSGVAGSLTTDGDCYYGNCVTGGWGGGLDWGVTGTTADDPTLDIDDIPGTGPENINIQAPAAAAQYQGWYKVVVHDYPGSVYASPNPCTINIYLNGALVNTYTFNQISESDYYYVAKIQWPTGQVVACNGLGGCP